MKTTKLAAKAVPPAPSVSGGYKNNAKGGLDTIHRLREVRHKLGTLRAASVVPVGDIQHYIGHAHLSTAEIYMHVAPKHDAAEMLTAAFGAPPPDSRPWVVLTGAEPTISSRAVARCT